MKKTSLKGRHNHEHGMDGTGINISQLVIQNFHILLIFLALFLIDINFGHRSPLICLHVRTLRVIFCVWACKTIRQNEMGNIMINEGHFVCVGRYWSAVGRAGVYLSEKTKWHILWVMMALCVLVTISFTKKGQCVGGWWGYRYKEKLNEKPYD